MSYSASFNTRQQMTTMDVGDGSTSVLNYGYGYDDLGRVTSITDGVNSLENRSFAYDALGRLVEADGPWGAGDYTYDLLNIIRGKALGLRTVEMEYDGSGRLDRYRDTNSGFTWRTYAYGRAPAGAFFAFIRSTGSNDRSHDRLRSAAMSPPMACTP